MSERQEVCDLFSDTFSPFNLSKLLLHFIVYMFQILQEARQRVVSPGAVLGGTFMSVQDNMSIKPGFSWTQLMRG